MVSWTETCYGLGYMLGPTVGATLYEAGGFMLPFFTIGGLSTVLSIPLCITIPNLETISSTGSNSNNDEKETDALVNQGESEQGQSKRPSCNGIGINRRLTPGYNRN